MPPLAPSLPSTAVTAAAAPLNEAGFLVCSATCLARSSAITLLLSRSIQPTIAASAGERTAATCVACRGWRPAVTGPATLMPSWRSSRAKASAASTAGTADRGRKLLGSSASCGLPEGVSRPWSTSSEVIGVTLPVLM